MKPVLIRQHEAMTPPGLLEEWLRERGIPVFGPGKAAAQLEGSKAFAKRVMDAAGVPTGRAVRAHTIEEVAAALDEFGAPFVVKADGLAAGKGVVVTQDRAAALAHAETYLPTGAVLVEEFLSGPEVSLFFVSDGDTVRALQELGGTLEARKDLIREIRTLLSGSVFTSYVVAGIGIAAIVLMNVFSPGVMREMTSSLAGLLALGVAGTLWAVAFVLIRATTKVDV